jgi:hypothetical protein
MAMAKQESDFAELLKAAPLAADPDTVSLVGTLARSPDPARFVLTLADGQSVTLEVEAVKSAKALAGAVGQSIVQLEIDAKRLPDYLLAGGYKARADVVKTQLGDIHKPLASDGGGSPPKERVENIGGLGGFSPFVAAMPHQAHPATIAALELFSLRTYFSANIWAGDQHHIMKVQADPQ